MKKATDLLKKQHREVKRLFKEALADGAERDVLEDLRRLLVMHTTIEERLFYPAIREINRKAEEMVDEALEEHHVVDLVLAELPKLDPSDDRYKAKMTVLRELVMHHVEEEEEEMFKLAERLGDEELTELSGRMEEEQQNLGA